MQVFALLLAGCQAIAPSRAARKDAAGETAQKLAKLEELPGLLVGELPVDGANSVVDGDTLKVKGLDSSLRLLAIDTEETFKHEEERRAFAGGWAAYKKKMRGESPRPVKMATPLGEDAKRFAQDFFTGVEKVRIERDHPGEIRDFYGRYLAYVFAFKDGQWVNYNLETVRAGMSPYFTKYGPSRRFGPQFLEAQKRAQAKQLGIWDPAQQHYDDYPERLTWWNGRGATIARFEEEMRTHDNYLALTRWDALLQLEKRIGKEVVVLASVGDIKLGDRGPTVVKLARSRTSDLEVLFFDKDVFRATGIDKAKGEFVRVRGVVHERKSAQWGDRLQLVVSLPGQVTLPGATGDNGGEPPAGDEPD